jgi:hypothetical protein
MDQQYYADVMPNDSEKRVIYLKIFCFVILYILTFITIISILFNTSWLNYMNNETIKIIFGLYLILTGYSIYKLATWRAIEDVIKMRKSGKLPTGNEDIYVKTEKRAHIISSFVFCLEGLIFFVCGALQFIYSYYNLLIFDDLLGKIIIFLCLVIPSILGALSKGKGYS